MENNKPVRAQILEKALSCTTGDRNVSYGAPTPNLELAAAFVKLYHAAAGNGKKYSPAHDQAIYLALHKLARIACGAIGHTDNYVDAAAYFAIAAECQEESVKVKVQDTSAESQMFEAMRSKVSDVLGIEFPSDSVVVIPEGYTFSHNQDGVYKVGDLVLTDTSVYEVCEIHRNPMEPEALIKYKVIQKAHKHTVGTLPYPTFITKRAILAKLERA